MLQGATNTDFNSNAVYSEVKNLKTRERESNANADTLQSRSEIDIIRLPAYNSTYSHNSSRLVQTGLSGKRYHQLACLTLLRYKQYSCHKIRGQSNQGQNFSNDK